MKSFMAPGGYTIVEVMIFLAVTSALFLVAMVAINGKQAQAEFAQGARDFHSRIDDIINDASNGNFPAAQVGCTAPAFGPPLLSSGSSADQGTNEACVYMGKVLHLQKDSKELRLYTVVGRRLNSAGGEIADFTDAQPIIDPGKGLLEQSTIQGDVQPTDIIVKKKDGSVTNNYGAIGFFTGFGSPDSKVNLGDTLVVPIDNTYLDSSTQDDVATAIEDIPTTYDSSTDSPETTVICLRQGGSGGKRAAVIIGSKGQQTTTDIRLDNIDDFVRIALYGTAGGTVQCPA